MKDILVWKVLCALVWNLHSLPFLPSPLWGENFKTKQAHITFHTRISCTSVEQNRYWSYFCELCIHWTWFCRLTCILSASAASVMLRVFFWEFNSEATEANKMPPKLSFLIAQITERTWIKSHHSTFPAAIPASGRTAWQPARAGGRNSPRAMAMSCGRRCNGPEGKYAAYTTPSLNITLCMWLHLFPFIAFSQHMAWQESRPA